MKEGSEKFWGGEGRQAARVQWSLAAGTAQKLVCAFVQATTTALIILYFVEVAFGHRSDWPGPGLGFFCLQGIWMVLVMLQGRDNARFRLALLTHGIAPPVEVAGRRRWWHLAFFALGICFYVVYVVRML